MSGSLNKVQLIGRLGKDPEVRNTQSGTKIVNLSVATSETWKDKHSGERKEKTEWHRVVIFNEGLAGVAERYLKKGALVYLEGKLQTRKWQDQSGNDRYSTEIVLANFDGKLTMLGGKNDGDSRRDDEDDDRSYQSGTQAAGLAGYGGPPRGGNDLDDEIPF